MSNSIILRDANYLHKEPKHREVKKKKRKRKIFHGVFTSHEKKRVFSLPIQQAVIVPSTTNGDKKISQREFNKRTNEVEKYLARKYGGYTETTAHGGYYSTSKNKVIKERVNVVSAYSQKKPYKQNLPETKKQLHKWGKEWKQESIGYENQGHLYYVNTDSD